MTLHAWQAANPGGAAKASQKAIKAVHDKEQGLGKWKGVAWPPLIYPDNHWLKKGSVRLYVCAHVPTCAFVFITSKVVTRSSLRRNQLLSKMVAKARKWQRMYMYLCVCACA